MKHAASLALAHNEMSIYYVCTMWTLGIPSNWISMYSWRAYFSVQPNLYVTYELDKPPLQHPLVFKLLTSSVRVLGQEQQVIKANSPSMAGWCKQAIEQMCEQILHIKKRSKEGGLKTITWLTRFKGHLNIMCNVWSNTNIAYSRFYNGMHMY